MKRINIKNNTEFIIIPLLLAVILIFAQVKILNNYLMQLLLLSCINIMMTQSLNLITGITGQPSLGHAGFMSIGAYISAMITTLLFNFSSMDPTLKIVVFLVATVCGGAVAAGFGFIIGIPTLRLRGDYLAIVTLGFGEVLRSFWRVFTPVRGAQGLAGIPMVANFFWIFIFMIITIYVCRNFKDSSYGRASVAIKENSIAADTIGINVPRYKMIAFVTSAFIAGVAGSMYAHMMGYLHPDVFSYSASTNYLVYLYAGGVGSISGSILGAVALTILPELLRFIGDWRLVIYGLLLTLVILFRQSGLFGGKEFAFLKINTNTYQKVGIRELLHLKKKTSISKMGD